jgi:hypothetical protein
MSNGDPNQIVSQIAGGAIVQYTVCVRDSSTGKWTTADNKNAAADFIGVAQSAASGDGAVIDMLIFGVTRCQMGDTTATYGGAVMVGTSGTAGKAIAQTGSGARTMGYILDPAAAASEEALIFFAPHIFVA